jgi:hypothetical protein
LTSADESAPPGPVTIDAGQVGFEPSSEVDGLVRRLVQGDVVDMPLPLVYLSNRAAPIWGLSHQYFADELEPDEDIAIVAQGADSQPRRWVITSQTCDLATQARLAPWVQLAPVYDLSGIKAEALAGIKNRKSYDYLWYLPALQGGEWVADLRIEIPVEKGVLLGAPIARGHLDEMSRYSFGHRLGFLRSRPALGDRFIDTVQKPIREALRKAKSKSATEDLVKCDVYLRLDDHLAPTRAGIVVLQEGGVPDHLRDWWLRQWELVRFAAYEVAAVDVLQPEFVDPNVMSATDFRSLVPFPLSGLSPFNVEPQ